MGAGLLPSFVVLFPTFPLVPGFSPRGCSALLRPEAFCAFCLASVAVFSSSALCSWTLLTRGSELRFGLDDLFSSSSSSGSFDQDTGGLLNLMSWELLNFIERERVGLTITGTARNTFSSPASLCTAGTGRKALLLFSFVRGTASKTTDALKTI